MLGDWNWFFIPRYPETKIQKSLIISEAAQNKTYTLLAPVRLSESEMLSARSPRARANGKFF